MVQRSCGIIPIDRAQRRDRKVYAAASSLDGLQTFGGLVVDTMGFGKTRTGLLFLSYFSLCASQNRIDFLPQNDFRPSLCLAPSGIVLGQWKDTMRMFPTLITIIAYGEKPSDPNEARNWVSATAMREAPAKTTHWPKHLRFVFDRQNPKACYVVLLSSYETFAARTLITHNKVVKNRVKKTFESKWADVFRVVLLDEGHRLRHSNTKTYASVSLLNADVHWFLTATPVINSARVCLLFGLVRRSMLIRSRMY